MEVLGININTGGVLVFGFALAWLTGILGAAVRLFGGYAFGLSSGSARDVDSNM